jgi:hypothetical protein
MAVLLLAKQTQAVEHVVVAAAAVRESAVQVVRPTAAVQRNADLDPVPVENLTELC